MKYEEGDIYRAVTIAVGDDGFKAKQVIDILRGFELEK